MSGELPIIDDILKLRKNLKSMNVLCNHFLPCVVGKKRWRMQIQAGKKINEVATVSDEAFVLLILQNIWQDMMKLDIDDYYRPKKRKKKSNDESNDDDNDERNEDRNNEDSTETNAAKEKDHSKVITGRWTNAWRGSRRYGGWSPEGLNQFNKLVAMVQQDRETDKHFQVQYEIWFKESVTNKKAKKKQTNNEPVVRAYRDLTSLGV